MPPDKMSRQRFYENDWLTVFATVVILLFHCARLFDHDDWHAKNNLLSDHMDLVVAVLSQWIMPLFFVLSGMNSSHSLRSKGARGYLANRVARLLVPFAFGTLVVLVPLQVWLERVGKGDFSGGFLDFYPHYFDGFYAFGGNFAWMGLHLWYLMMLFLFSLLTLPLLALCERLGPRRALARTAALLDAPGGALVFALPILLMQLDVNLDPHGIGIRVFGGWSPLTYLVFFLIGSVLSSAPAFRSGLAKSGPASMALGLALTLSLILVPALPHHDYLLTNLLLSLNSWLWLVGILGLGVRFLNRPGKILDRLRTAAMPFYILHQTVIVCTGFVIAGWSLPVAAKYPLLVVASFAVTATGSALVVRHGGPLRPLFGLPRTPPAIAGRG